jgi:putative nucleotidyltransferase with HDIG domain
MKREEAEQLLSWAQDQNPGPWINHCEIAARAAEAIAAACGLDTERAYVSGLLHDIGYYDYRNGKSRKADHIFTGFDLMTQKGHDGIARICLTHSFSLQDIKAFSSSWIHCDDREMAFITQFLADAVYNDYDKLIQLCDALASAQSVVLMEKRLLDVVRRHGVREYTVAKWESTFALKAYFDEMCGMNIYDLFKDEIVKDIFGND